MSVIQDAGLTHAFTTYQAENAHQGFLFTSNTAVYVNCLGVKPRGFFLRLSVTLPCHSRSGDL